MTSRDDATNFSPGPDERLDEAIETELTEQDVSTATVDEVRRLYQDKVKELNIKVTDKQVDAAIERIKENNQ